MGKRRKKNHKLNLHPHSAISSSVPQTVSEAAPKPVAMRETAVYQNHQAEYKAISSDLVRVAVINGFFLAAVLALYFVDRSNPFLKDLFARII